MFKRMLWAAGIVSVGAASCSAGEVTPEGEALNVHSQAVRNGTPVLFPQLDSTVRIIKNGKNAGSGTLLAGDWVLTAGHVAEGIQYPVDLAVHRGNEGDITNEIRYGYAVYHHPKHKLGGATTSDTTDVDVALLRLAAPFSSPAIRGISNESSSDFVNTELFCSGYGMRIDGDTSSYGFLSSASLPVYGSGSNWMSLKENQTLLFGSQHLLQGDSGGACIDPLTGEIVGVISACVLDQAFLATASSFRSWANDTIADCSEQVPGTEDFATAKCRGTNHAVDCDPDTCASGFTCDLDVGSAFGMKASWDVCVLDQCAELTQGANNYCSSTCRCGYGGGDCEPSPDKHCVNGMSCRDDLGPAFGMKPSTDVCVYDVCFKTNPIGHKDFCTASCKCGYGGGDCDTGQCMPGLTCANAYGAAFNMPSGTDVCVTEGCEGRTVYGASFCTATCPCGIGGGQCTADSQCMPGLKCGTNNGASFGRPASNDLCYLP